MTVDYDVMLRARAWTAAIGRVWTSVLPAADRTNCAAIHSRSRPIYLVGCTEFGEQKIM
jgi:hypothetical protein